jgi:DNA-directed RNA polymerase specialized sigma24 family protein
MTSPEAALHRSETGFAPRGVDGRFDGLRGERCEGDVRVEGFEAFYRDAEPRLRRALVASLGPERGRDAVAEALAYAWEHWERVRGMDKPVGYLYRVGQTRSRSRREPVEFPLPAEVGMPWVEPGLAGALARLSENQRVAVVLAHGFGWHREVGDVLGVAASTVQNHVERGLANLRAALEVSTGG